MVDKEQGAGVDSGEEFDEELEESTETEETGEQANVGDELSALKESLREVESQNAQLRQTLNRLLSEREAVEREELPEEPPEEMFKVPEEEEFPGHKTIFDALNKMAQLFSQRFKEMEERISAPSNAEVQAQRLAKEVAGCLLDTNKEVAAIAAKIQSGDKVIDKALGEIARGYNLAQRPWTLRELILEYLTHKQSRLAPSPKPAVGVTRTTKQTPVAKTIGEAADKFEQLLKERLKRGG